MTFTKTEISSSLKKKIRPKRKYKWLLETINEETTPLNQTRTNNHEAIVPISNVQATNVYIEDFDTAYNQLAMLQRSKDRLFYLSIILVICTRWCAKCIVI